MIKLLRIILAVTLIAVSSGCSMLVREPVITVLSTDIVSIDTAGVDLELLVGVENTNSYSVSLLGYTYDLQIMSIPFSSGGLQKEAEFPSHKRIDVRLPLRVHHSDLIGVIKRRPDLDNIPYTLNAKLNLKSPFGELTTPINKSSTVSVPAAYRPETYLKRILQPFKELR